MSVSPRVALVTGGAARIGCAVVEELAARGWSVVFSYHTSLAAANELASRLSAAGAAVEAVHANLDDAASRGALVAAAAERFGRIDALVNNAAVFHPTPVALLREEDLRGMMRTNLEAPLFLTLAAADLLRASRGAVVNIADIYGVRPLRNHLAYSVSKAALIAATKALAIELAPEIRVNAVAPGIAVFPDDWDEATRARLVDRTLLKREGGADEIARAVRYLIEDARFATGELLIVDGGRSIAG